MTRRITINLAVFGTLGVVLIVWALLNVVSFDFIKRPYVITAEFSASPGLQPNFDVAYLGVTVGKIKSVRLGDHKVVARLDINRGASIPSNVTAAAGRQSAIGEPYVDLEPPAGAATAPPMRAGAVIPVSRTSVAVSYGDLFAAANRAVGGLNAQDLHTVTQELGAGWDGRGDSLRKIVDSSSQITGTFAKNTALLDALVRQLTETTGTLSAHRNEIGGSLDDLAALTDVLAASHSELVSIREQTPKLLGRFNQLLADSSASNACTLTALGTALPTIMSGGALPSLEYELRTSPQLVAALNEISPKVNGKSNLNIDFVITLDKPKPALEYKTPMPLPTVGAIPSCPGVSVPKAATAQAGAKAQGSPAGASGGSGGQATENARPASQRSPLTDPWNWAICLPPLLALAVLVKVAGRAVPVLNRRRRRKEGR